MSDAPPPSGGGVQGEGGSCTSGLALGFSVPPHLLPGWTLFSLHLLHTGQLPGAQDVGRSGPAGQLQGSSEIKSDQTKLLKKRAKSMWIPKCYSVLKCNGPL